jgi:hypothetical protein
MPEHLCILGDSHASGFRRLIRDGAAGPYRFDCYAHSSRVDINMGMMRATSSGHLVPTSAPLKESLDKRFSSHRVDVNRYAAICLIGLRLEFPYKLVNDYYHHRDELKSMLCTQSVFASAQRDLIVDQSISMKLALEIRKINADIPLVIVPNPLLSAQLKSTGTKTLLGIEPRVAIPPVRFFARDSWPEWRSILEQAFAGLNASFLYQPDETVTDGIFTPSEFATSDGRDGGLRHMNAAFWEKLYLRLPGCLGKRTAVPRSSGQGA